MKPKLTVLLLFLFLSFPVAFGQTQTEGHVFISLPVCYRPQGGMTKFMTRWAEFLEALENESRVDTNSSPRFTHFFVRLDGSLYVPDQAPFALHLETFLAKEKRWSPGILSGRPLPHRVNLEVVATKTKHLRYELHPLHPKSSIESPVFYSGSEPSFEGMTACASAIYVQGKYCDFRVHQGNAAAIQQLKDNLDINDDQKMELTTAMRTYFYTLD